MGLSPHPEKSFGLTPCHWAVTGLSETGWDPMRQQSIPKDPLDIEKQALKCGKMLAVLEHLGFSPDEKVIKVPKTEYRRPPGLVKVGLSAWDYLEDRLQSKSKFLTPETLALVRQAYLAQSQPQPTLSSSVRSRRL